MKRTMLNIDEGYECVSVVPICIQCEETTKSAYTCAETAECAAKNLGWRATKRGYVCAECLVPEEET